MVNRADVAVIGAGVVGLSTALHLARAGATVEVVDADGTGSGASRANAGWVVPSMSAPVPSPAAFRTAARWMFQKDGPLKVAFEPSARYLYFLARMLTASRSTAYHRGFHATAALAANAIGAFDELVALGVNFERHANGALMLFLDEAEIEPHVHQHRTAEQYGLSPACVLSATDIREIEPAVGPKVVGGILTTGDQHVDPSTLVDGLVEKCADLGVRLRLQSPVRRVGERSGRIHIDAGREETEAGTLVVAAGVGSRTIARMLDSNLPVRGGRGYGFDYRPAPLQLNRPVYLTGHKVAVTPLENGLRLAGTMEFGTENGVIDARRAAGVATSMTHYFRDWTRSAPQPWTALRPMTPDGLPLIGRLQGSAPVFVATGHAMLGVTLGPITGKLLARLIVNGDDSHLLEPFDPTRFRRVDAHTQSRPRRGHSEAQ